MSWKEWAADYLNFTRKDRIAIITLLLLISVIFFLPVAISRKNNSSTVNADTAWIAAMERITRIDSGSNSRYSNEENDNPQAYQYDRRKGNYPVKPAGELFDFDPNTLTAEGWQKLGLREKTIVTIQNFLSKGGEFRKPEDLQRIYGLFPDEYERIAPYIKIEARQEANTYKNFDVKDPGSPGPSKTFTGRYTIIDINEADSAAWIALPGIGNKLANRIIGFRDKLGGFHSISQVGETFGLPDSTFQKIKQWLKLENSFIRKININTATLEELKAHPYIRYNLANPIVAYREQHGPFSKIDGLKKIMIITDELYNKLLPYLTIEN
jgi:competence protein ComEA